MRDFLTDFYNKVINFFQAEKVEGENTKETAKNRLKLVLMQDRSNLEPETMAQLREELVEVISKYIVIDKEALGLNLDGDGESMALMLNIPVIRAKKPEEIKEALEAAKAKKAQTDDEQEEKTEVDEIEEETIVEFSEGSIDELDLPCDGECKCGCQNGEPCSCGENASEEKAAGEDKVEEETADDEPVEKTEEATEAETDTSEAEPETSVKSETKKEKTKKTNKN